MPSEIVFVLKSDLRVSEVRGIVNVKCVRDGYQTVQAALLDYTLTCYPTIQVYIHSLNTPSSHVRIENELLIRSRKSSPKYS